MKRRRFLQVAGGTVLVAGGLTWLSTDKTNFVRKDIKDIERNRQPELHPDEREILYLASLAPSGHNAQPWLVKRKEPFHWVICNDRTKWLMAVDPGQRETILSIGAFMQNLEYAAGHYGYHCKWSLLASSNQDEDIIDVSLLKATGLSGFDISKIKQRRTIRFNYLPDSLKREDFAGLAAGEEEYIYYIPKEAREFKWLNEQTIEANRQQIYRDAAEEELGKWVRFSSKEAKLHCDGLTPASMEIEGLSGWVVRNFYNRSSVMKKSFREQGLDNVKKQVGQSGGWLLITSNNAETRSLLETGMRLQRILLRVREKGIAIHPMTQVLEELPFAQNVNKVMGVTAPIQFILRCGYVKNYPNPVSLRRPVDWFVKSS
ncbi:hypothetical protein SAMN04488505_108222 [Chitinophaga rupis]|uniref:Nitroreductase n=1 Tax=Chitinophaga rupis TaxID=573321 RepID=A0A1H8E8S9_9BACT|nr:nitroreductase [Chitinophaga rupis]SEN15929.1 hypothetical protein SAMN04488505_108222 [Chitinophaga rupis]